jgi:glycerol-3-phosphate acyltransferase PlsY
MLRFLWIVAGYIMGSIPFAYLAGRLLRGIDIRHYGTKTVGGSNVYENVSKPAVVVVGVLDMAKAGLATWLGIRLGLGLPTALASGLAAVAGHNWPLSLGFHGGRGIGTCLGILTVVFPWGFVWMLLFLLIGWVLNNAMLPLLGFITLAALVHFTGQPIAMTLAVVGMLLLTIAKRLEANRAPLPDAREEKRAVLLRRLLLDRDIEDWQDWAHRRPGKTKTN